MEREKVLKVIEFPQNNAYVPGIRIAGKWLSGFEFNFGDSVKITAKENIITIEKIKGDEKS
jgi:hypothetical protein